MLIHVINGEQSLARIDHVTSTCALVVGQSPSVRTWQKSLRDLCLSPDHPPSKIDPEASSLLQATLFILSCLKENTLPSFSHRPFLKELQLICGDSLFVISPRFFNWVSSIMAASKPKRSVKQPLNPDFVYDFPAMVFPFFFLILIQMRLPRRPLSRLHRSQWQRQLWWALWQRRNLQNPPRFKTNWSWSG